MTYGQISAVLDSPYSARVVGFAMNAAPEALGLPCHRVVNRLGECAPPPAFGGPGVQKKLLEAEGVPFLPNGRINMDLALYDPARDGVGDGKPDLPEDAESIYI